MDYQEHLLRGDNRLVVAFASGDQSHFQFGRTLAGLGLSHVLIRDSFKRWYQQGIVGLETPGHLIEYLREFVDTGYRVTTLGLSAGAYAALYYGQMAVVEQIIAISPVTGAERGNFDPRWHHKFMPQPGDPQILDLKEVFATGPAPRTTAFVSTGQDCELDRHMAERIGITDIRMVPGYDHETLARGLRDNGILETMLRA